MIWIHPSDEVFIFYFPALQDAKVFMGQNIALLLSDMVGV